MFSLRSTTEQISLVRMRQHIWKTGTYQELVIQSFTEGQSLYPLFRGRVQCVRAVQRARTADVVFEGQCGAKHCWGAGGSAPVLSGYSMERICAVICRLAYVARSVVVELTDYQCLEFNN